MQPRDYQAAARDAVFNHLSVHGTNPIVAMPTGTGKSVVIGDIIRCAHGAFPQTRSLMLTHVQELVEQNHAKLKAMWPTAPSGVYSAGLGRKELGFPITYGSVQSVAPIAHLLGHIDFVIVDEAHMVSPKEETTYVKVIETLMLTNPYVKEIGFTATPYRLGLGLLTNGPMFDQICFDLTSRDQFNRLLAEGYIARLIPKATSTTLSLEGVKIRGGEFAPGDLQTAVDKSTITEAAVKEMILAGEDRKHWLVFAAGLKHAANIVDMFEHYGISATMVDGKMSTSERESRLGAFKSGEIRAMVNNAVLTTGFDFPEIDMIGMLRPTMSPSLWVQMLGRGTRPSPGKENCLVLDFARNTVRLGPINDPVLPRAKDETKGLGVAPIKLCEACGTFCHTSVRNCPECGWEFPEKLDKWTMTASDAELIASSLPQVEPFAVNRVSYQAHHKIGKPVSMRVSYHCGIRTFSEYICLEHVGFAKKKALDWWRLRSQEIPPATVEEALEVSQMLQIPKSIMVWVNREHPQIMSCEF